MIENVIKECLLCTKCKTIEGYRQFPINTHGNRQSKAMIIGEAPGKASLENGRFWIGAGGKLIRSVLLEITNKSLEEIFYLTDIVKCWPGDNRKPKANEIKNCFDFLREEIDCLSPKYILIFGAKAYKSCSLYLVPHKYQNKSISEMHNISIHYNGILVMPFLHPSNINLHMPVEEYKRQLTELFQKIIMDLNQDNR